MNDTAISVDGIAPINHREAMVLAETEYRRYTGLLSQLQPEDWAIQTVNTDWNVKQLAQHVLGFAESNASFLVFAKAMRAGKRRAARDGYDHFIHGVNAVQVEEREHLTPGELVTRWEATWPRALKGRRRFPSIMRPIPLDFGPIIGKKPMGSYLMDVVFTRDTWMHRIDICRAARIEPVLTPEHDGRLIEDMVAEWTRLYDFELTPSGCSRSDRLPGRPTLPLESAQAEHDRLEVVVRTDPGAERADPLGLDPDAMRRLGHWVVEAVVEHFEQLADKPVLSTRRPDDLSAMLGGPPPEEPGDAVEAMTTLVDVVLANMQHGDHPRYFARVPSPASFAAVLGDWLATGFNAIAASWAGGSGPTAIELGVIEWLRTLLGMPEGTEGVLTSGGSLANLTGILAARHAVGPGAVYLSDQTHASIARDLMAAGVPAEHVRTVPTDRWFRLPVDVLLATVHEDRRNGLAPAIVVATAGTTNTGAVDPLVEIAALCRQEAMWFHVDGAYGAPAALCDKGRAVLAGIEQADSVVLDPHKWLFQPYDVGSLLVRRPGALEAMFDMSPEYLADTTASATEVDMRDRGLELSRRARAIKVWLTFHTYGLRQIRSAISRGIELAEYAESLLASDDRWQVVTPAQLGIVTFARLGDSPEDAAQAAARVTKSGWAAVSSTVLHGTPALRLCTINPRTTEADIALTIEQLGASV